MEIITRKEAIEQGLKRYFTGKPCKRGHIAERYASNRGCTICSGESWRKYREENSGKINAHRREWYKENPGKDLAKNRKYRKANPLKNREWCRKKYKSNPGKHMERCYKYRQENPGKHTALSAKRRADKIKRTPLWANLNAIADVYQVAQALTKITGITYSVDQIIPLRGKLVSGLHVENNLQVMPLIENISKNNKFNPMEYNQPIGMLL